MDWSRRKKSIRPATESAGPEAVEKSAKQGSEELELSWLADGFELEITPCAQRGAIGQAVEIPRRFGDFRDVVGKRRRVEEPWSLPSGMLASVGKALAASRPSQLAWPSRRLLRGCEPASVPSAPG
jgi:hypothetical protein